MNAHTIKKIIAGAALLSFLQGDAIAAKSPTPDSTEIQVSILTYMVTNKPTDTSLVYFVELRPDSLEVLKKQCGSAFHIHGTNQLQRSSNGFVLRGTSAPGVLLYLRPVEVHGDTAQARGVYHYGTPIGMSDSRYKLRRKNGKWHVISCEFVCAS
jgi:hypothetical protein